MASLPGILSLYKHSSPITYDADLASFKKLKTFLAEDLSSLTLNLTDILPRHSLYAVQFYLSSALWLIDPIPSKLVKKIRKFSVDNDLVFSATLPSQWELPVCMSYD